MIHYLATLYSSFKLNIFVNLNSIFLWEVIIKFKNQFSQTDICETVNTKYYCTTVSEM